MVCVYKVARMESEEDNPDSPPAITPPKGCKRRKLTLGEPMVCTTSGGTQSDSDSEWFEGFTDVNKSPSSGPSTSAPSTSRSLLRTPPGNATYYESESEPDDIADEDSDGFVPLSDSDSDDNVSESDDDQQPAARGSDGTSRPRAGGTRGRAGRPRAGRAGRAAVPEPPRYVWTDGDNYVPNVYAFDDSASGVTDAAGVDMNSTELDYFQLFIDDELIDLIVQETNRYYQFIGNQRQGLPLAPHSKMRRWHDTTGREVYTFLALTLLMAHIKKHMVRDYWNKDPLLSTPVFPKYMVRDRYQLLLRFIHFTDNERPLPNDRLWKVRPVMSMLIPKFRQYFIPYQKDVIDESLVLFKGRMKFKQYIPSKRHRFGIKVFVLCDCQSGMILDMIVYSGSDIDVPTDDPIGFAGSVVKTMMHRYLDKGHILYTDNWYTGPLLSEYLHIHNTGSCGTLRKDKKFTPKCGGRERRGTCQRLKSDPSLFVRWTDKREVRMLTTVHRGNMEDSGKVDYKTNEPVMKPDCVIDYTKNMRLVDKSDAQIGTVECVRRTVKWYKKLFFHFVDVSMLNAFNIYRLVTRKKISLRLFSLEVVRQLLVKYGTLANTSPGRHRVVATDRLLAKEYILRHHLEYLPPSATRNISQRLCHVCQHTERRGKQKKKVSTWCKECGVALCIGCFTEYHTCATF